MHIAQYSLTDSLTHSLTAHSLTTLSRYCWLFEKFFFTVCSVFAHCTTRYNMALRSVQMFPLFPMFVPMYQCFQWLTNVPMFPIFTNVSHVCTNVSLFQCLPMCQCSYLCITLPCWAMWLCAVMKVVGFIPRSVVKHRASYTGTQKMLYGDTRGHGKCFYI